jgi:hypothetical protein
MQTSLISQIKHRPVFVFLILIIGFYLINGIFYLRAQSLTSDEGSFLFYASRLAKGHPERIYPQADNSKMPPKRNWPTRWWVVQILILNKAKTLTRNT